jgi:hypothetical protein
VTMAIHDSDNDERVPAFSSKDAEQGRRAA